MKEIITSAEAREVECEGAFYPYADKFTISLVKGKNEVEFESEAHYNRFIQAVTGDIMCGEIIIGEVADEVEETQETETKSSKKSKKKAEND